MFCLFSMYAFLLINQWQNLPYSDFKLTWQLVHELLYAVPCYNQNNDSVLINHYLKTQTNVGIWKWSQFSSPQTVEQIKHRTYAVSAIFLFNAGNQLLINNIVILCYAISTRGQCSLNICTSASFNIFIRWRKGAFCLIHICFQLITGFVFQ